MNHLHHPISKYERLVVKDKKESGPDDQKNKKKKWERPGRVQAKLLRAQAKEQDTEHELKEFLTNG